MPDLPQYTYIFALGVVFAFLDAYSIGANDVANSFSTSVSSRSLTLKQAALIATFCEVLPTPLVLSAELMKVFGSVVVGISSCANGQTKN